MPETNQVDLDMKKLPDVTKEERTNPATLYQSKHLKMTIHQFFRAGIRDVITIDLSKFKRVNNWKSLEEQIEEWLP